MPFLERNLIKLHFSNFFIQIGRDFAKFKNEDKDDQSPDKELGQKIFRVYDFEKEIRNKVNEYKLNNLSLDTLLFKPFTIKLIESCKQPTSRPYTIP